MSSLLVVKFGGGVLRNLSSLQEAVRIVLKRRTEETKVLVVVSALANMTDELLQLALQITPEPPKREQDMLVSVGERIAMALLAMAFSHEGVEAMSFTGSQAGIITTNDHGCARILEVKPHRIAPYLDQGKVVIVAGFQGVSENGQITTLTRGGTDITAVALGAHFGADQVEFFKDVGAIHTQDPKIYPMTRPFDALDFTTAKAIMASSVHPIIHPEALSLAEKHALPLVVRPFCASVKGGTRIACSI